MKQYTLKNYKMIENYEFDLNKINIVVGENSSGKSSFLRSLQLLKQTAHFSFEKLHTNFKEGIDFGEYSNLVKNKNESTVGFKIVLDKKIKSYGDFLIEGVEWVYEKNNLKKIIIILNESTLEIILNKNKLEKIKLNNQELEISDITMVKYIKEFCFPMINSVNSENVLFRYMEASEKAKISEEDRLELLKLLINKRKEIYLNKDLKFDIKYNGSERHILKRNILNEQKKIVILNSLDEFRKNEISYMANKILEDISKELKRKFMGIIYTGAIRALGERYYRIVEDEFSGDYTVNNDISRQLYNFKTNKTDSLKLFNNFIYEHFNFKIDVITLNTKDNEPIFFFVEIEKDGKKNNLVDVGAGYSQILPILYACFGKERNISATIVIEQPELHLHPKMQSDLLDLILKLSKKNPNLKFIIETHSSLVIDRIGKNIMMENYNSKDINVFIFNKKENLEIKKTKYGEDGILEEWPIRFFSAKELKKW